MKFIAAAFLSCFALGAQAQSTIHTYEFTAKVDHLYKYDFNENSTPDSAGGKLAGTVISLGDKVTGYLTYDSASPQFIFDPFPAHNPDSTAPGGFTYGAPGLKNEFSFTIQPSGQKFSSKELRTWTSLAVNHQVGGADSFGISAGDYPNDADVVFSAPSVFTNGHIPTSLSLSVFTTAYAISSWTSAEDGSWVMATARLDSLTEVSAVPEPETYAMMLAGVLLIGYSRSRTAKAA
ncbi:PEP-CTERM sorting domain-containing protein [Rugamonas sp. FT103W]|uniref:PEP-CTERM sorting domain-containing protein n=2 Tax=Rugamonas rivuli TaxID=2743358 RepID=A0A843SDT4_9BURK|nr:PEP-CTERM sorting domain-containing protein [Rugamonas rivuli]